MSVRGWWRRVTALVRREKYAGELEEEMAFHREQVERELRAEGMSAEEARYAAARQFGNEARLRDRSREVVRFRVETLLQDARFALRQMGKNPGFAVTAVLMLALGIGAMITVAIWTNAVVFDPWPQVRDVRSLRFIDATVLGSDGYSVHYNEIAFALKNSKAFSAGATFESTELNLNGAQGEPEVLAAGTVSSNFFQVLGVEPERGRFFEADADDRAWGAHDEVVLSDALWRTEFGADAGLIGRAISINRHPFTVIGIAPKGFLGIYGGLAQAAWVPLSSLRDLTPDAAADPLAHYGLQAVVRLRPGVSDAAAQAELRTMASRYAAARPGQGYEGWTLNLRDCTHFERGLFYGIAELLPVLGGASLLLMALVCLNIASLLGQQAARRKREVAIRTAMGATPGRIARQMLVETGILAAAGAAAGWASGLGLAKGLYVLLPNFGFPLAFNLENNARIDGLAAAIAVAVTLVCGLAPVRQSLRASQREALHEGGAAVAGAGRKRRGQRVVLGLQLGICFLVLVCCGLLTHTALNVFQRDPGFDRRNVLTANVDLSRGGYDEARGQALLTELLSRLRHVPGAAAVTLTTHLPMGDTGSGNTRSFSVPGYVPAKGEDMEVVTDYDGPDYFRTMGIALEQGRDFTAADNAGSAKVAIVNEAMAHHYWPKGNALGSRIVADGDPREIVGIVPDFTYNSPSETEASPVLYLPYLQGKNGYGYAILAVRSRTTAEAMAAPLRQAVASLDRTLPLEHVQTLEQVTDEQYLGIRVPAELLGVYALASLFVAIIGLYAVMAFSVIERSREFALRMALGSTRESIFRLVLRGATGIVLLGVVTGGLGSMAAVRLLRSMLFGVAPWDPVSYLAAAGLLVLTVFLSGLAPARRAATVDPMVALRSE